MTPQQLNKIRWNLKDIIIVTPKITCSYWFVIIFLLMLKNIPNMSNYSVICCFFFFFNLTRFRISLIVLPSISFFSLKWFLTSLIMLLFFIIFKPWTFHQYTSSKNILTFFRIRVYFTSFKMVFENIIFIVFRRF